MRADSLEVVVVGGDKRTPLDEFLWHISSGQFAVPTEGHWREHDRVFHFPRLAGLQREEARLATGSARIGVCLLETGELTRAVELADNIDHFLSVDAARAESQKYLWRMVEHYGFQEHLF
jgi:hypothetical protein